MTNSGRFDFVGGSHFWWHVLVFAAMLYWHRSGMSMLAFYHSRDRDPSAGHPHSLGHGGYVTSESGAGPNQSSAETETCSAEPWRLGLLLANQANNKSKNEFKNAPQMDELGMGMGNDTVTLSCHVSIVHSSVFWFCMIWLWPIPIPMPICICFCLIFVHSLITYMLYVVLCCVYLSTYIIINNIMYISIST